jgi:glycosyltransferase involved in cell wall biosynthesis
MLVRVVDYIANPGGGCRFVVEMLRAFRRVSAARFEVVSHGRGLETYAGLLGDDFRLVDVPPSNSMRRSPPWNGIPGARLLNAVLGTPDFHVEVPAAAVADCDLAWFPWLHRHRVPAECTDRVVATLHDCIGLEFPGVLDDVARRNEFQTIQGWLASRARILFTSNATVSTVERLFGTRGTAAVVPLSAKHDPVKRREARRVRPFPGAPYLLCPTNVSPHKNLEALLDGFAAWGAHVPLVVTGPGTDLRDPRDPRQARLLSVMERRGLVRERDVFALGYVDDADYYEILDGAWALAMPTLAEGGGSFPVLEAMERGIPCVVSDIPVLREMGERWRMSPTWCDARDPRDVAAKLAALEGDYAGHLARARAQVPGLLQRGWEDVAREYALEAGIRLRDR